MITFTKSIDGTPRATFRTEHRLSVGDLVELLAYAAVRGADDGALHPS